MYNMDLEIENESFIVGGAGAGFGRAIAIELAKEGSKILAISKTEQKLQSLVNEYPNQIEYLAGDIMSDNIQLAALRWAKENSISGIVFNAAGPPAGSVEDINMDMWDSAWESIVRWKINFIHKLLPTFKEQKYGRLLFIESVSVKEPIPNLVLSNSLRLAVVGFVKTLSQELANKGITCNILAPGYHSTAAMERLFVKKSEIENISIKEAKTIFEEEVPVGKMGKPEELATLACWLLSPLSRYVNGQTLTHDGGMVKSIFG